MYTLYLERDTFPMSELTKGGQRTNLDDRSHNIFIPIYKLRILKLFNYMIFKFYFY